MLLNNEREIIKNFTKTNTGKTKQCAKWVCSMAEALPSIQISGSDLKRLDWHENWQGRGNTTSLCQVFEVKSTVWALKEKK